MAEVDPDDDSVHRFVLGIRRRAEGRRGWSHVVLAAFDDEAEYHLRRRALADEMGVQDPVVDDGADHFTWAEKPPGYQAGVDAGRIARRLGRPRPDDSWVNYRPD